MALYLVRTRAKKDLLENLHEELSSGKISRIGQALQYALENAKIDIENTDFALLKEDYRSPPLAMERENVWKNRAKRVSKTSYVYGKRLILSLYHISQTNRLSISSVHFASSDMNN